MEPTSAFQPAGTVPSLPVPEAQEGEARVDLQRQCPRDSSLLYEDERGPYCVVCGFRIEERSPDRPPELTDLFEQFCRAEPAATWRRLRDVARHHGLRWGSLGKAGSEVPFLEFDDVDGSLLAIQEAQGSRDYFVVLKVAQEWDDSLFFFFKLEEGKDGRDGQVRTTREAIARLVPGERPQLNCITHGLAEPLARPQPPPPPRSLEVTGRRVPEPQPVPPVVSPPAPQAPVRVPTAWIALASALALAALLAGSFFQKGPGTAQDVQVASPPPPYSIAEGNGELEVEVEPPARGSLDGFYLPQSGRDAASRLVWNLPARTYRLKVQQTGYQAHVENVSIRRGERLTVKVALARGP